MKDAVKARAIMRALISAVSTAQFGENPGAFKRLFAGVVSAGILLTPAHAADVELLPSLLLKTAVCRGSSVMNQATCTCPGSRRQKILPAYIIRS